MVEIILVFLLEEHLYPCANSPQQVTSYPCYLSLFYLNERSIIRNVQHMVRALYQVFSIAPKESEFGSIFLF